MSAKHLRIFRDIPENYHLGVNPYVKKLKESCADKTLDICYGPFLENKQGKWRENFTSEEKPNDVILEIGCHKGKILCQIAKDHPKKAFIGLDITYKRVYETAALAKEQQLKNTKAVFANAKEMEHIFAQSELTGVIIFFPDPWLKKKKQAKNKLLNHEFCAILKQVLKPNGFVWFKTDAYDYFVNTNKIFTELEFCQSSLDETCFTRNYVSTFESRFHKQSCTTYESVWVNNSKRGSDQ